MKNLAKGKPTSQSSTGEFSSNASVLIDSQIAVNGDTASNAYFHTADEPLAWWQVDLEEVFNINEVVIYNRLDHKERLKHFTIFASIDGIYWTRLFSRITGEAFDVLPISIAKKKIARFIRVRVDERYPLHFRELEVFGEAIGVEEKVFLIDSFLQKQNIKKLHLEKSLDLATVGAFQVLLRDGYGDVVRQSIISGNYEREERTLAGQWLKADDKVIEIGTAIGIVSMTIASIVGPANIITFEANPYIMSDAKDNFIINDFEEIKCMNALLRNRKDFCSGETVDFMIEKDFWASRLAMSNEEKTYNSYIKVSTVCLEDVISAYHANVIVCDIEGAEVELFLEADLSKIEKIIVETHYAIAGEAPTDRMVSRLAQQGLHIHLGVSGRHVSVFRRHK